MTTRKYSAKETLFKFPEKTELPKQKPIGQQYDVIKWQNQDVVEDRSQKCISLFASQKLKDWLFNKQNRKARTRKHQENNNHLPRTPQVPPFF